MSDTQDLVRIMRGWSNFYENHPWRDSDDARERGVCDGALFAFTMAAQWLDDALTLDGLRQCTS